MNPARKPDARDAIAAELRRRIRDYETHDVSGDRERLIAMWRREHPEATAEPASGVHRTLDQLHPGDPRNLKDAPEQWANDVYHVTVRRWPEDSVFGSRGGMIQIGISSHDGTARHDWRDFQGIKNQIAGAECEAFELYPAESRLLDPSNYYTLWCFPGVRRLKIGVDQGRRVYDAGEALAPQRAFGKA